MTVAKKSPNSKKVSNSKVSFKNGKNAQAESQMKRAFEPLFSAIDGKARLTFVGVEHSIIEWSNNGKNHERAILKLAFSVFDVTHENPVVIGIQCDYRYSATNRLGRVLSLMGFKFDETTEIIDVDDEFGSRKKDLNVGEIFDFLRAQCGLVFKGELKHATRKNKTTGERYETTGLWDIVAESLEPKLDKEGNQQRDIEKNSMSDEQFENPSIDMESESE